MLMKNKKAVFSWVLYDFGNSAFATTIMAAVLPVFDYDVAAKGLDESLAASGWGYSQSIAVLLAAVLAPILGAISDYSAAKRSFSRLCCSLGVLARRSLSVVGAAGEMAASVS